MEYKAPDSDEWKPVVVAGGDTTEATVKPPGAIPGQTYQARIVPAAGDTESPDSVVKEITLSECAGWCVEGGG